MGAFEGMEVGDLDGEVDCAPVGDLVGSGGVGALVGDFEGDLVGSRVPVIGDTEEMVGEVVGHWPSG